MSALEDRLRDAVPPDGPGAEDRAWAVVRAAAPGPGAARRSSRRPWPAVVAALLLVAATLAAAGRPGEAVGEWVHRQVAPAPPPAAPATPAALPGGGTVLAVSEAGSALVPARGPARPLRRFRGAALSPRGRFVAGFHGGTLRAVDRRDRTRWLLRATGTIRAAAWSPDGVRVAYFADGAGIRVVAGDGTGDHPYGPRALAPVVAWRPGDPHTLTTVDRYGRVDVRNADTGALTARTATGLGRGARALVWSADGRRLAIPRGGSLIVWDLRRNRVQRSALPVGWYAVDAAWAPGRDALAVLLRAHHRAGSRILVLPAGNARRSGNRDLNGVERLGWPVALDGVHWSPDGRWLLSSWRAAGEWLFVSAGGRPRVVPRAAPRGATVAAWD